MKHNIKSWIRNNAVNHASLYIEHMNKVYLFTQFEYQYYLYKYNIAIYTIAC
jgi:hypothetical protein